MNNRTQKTNTPKKLLWKKLSPYGDWPHGKLIQRLDYEAAREMVNRFESWGSRFLRGFRGAPLYLGHPDDPSFKHLKEHSDPTRYGEVIKLEARSDGLWAALRLSSQGRRHLRKHRHLSPRWVLRILNHEAQIFKPVRLLSVGLTEQPNINPNLKPQPYYDQTLLPTQKKSQRENPKRQSTHPREPSKQHDFVSECAQSLGLPKSATQVQVLSHLEERIRAERQSRSAFKKLRTECEHLRATCQERNTQSEENRLESDRFYRIACDAQETCERLRSENRNLERARQEERDQRIELILEAAIRDQKITRHDEAHWREVLQADLERGLRDLEEVPRRRRQKTRVGNLAQRNEKHQRLTHAPLLVHVHQRMAESGESYPEAWAHLKRTHRELFDASA